MERGCRSDLARVALAALVALALAAAGWAHRGTSTVERSSLIALSAFVSLGGSLADICGDQQHEKGSEAHCPVCLTPGALPFPALALPARMQAARTVAARREGAVPSPSDRHPAWQQRAPPII